MEKLEQTSLQSAVPYVDDTFMIWNHGEIEFGKFLTHLNDIHPRIQFTKERKD